MLSTSLLSKQILAVFQRFGLCVYVTLATAILTMSAAAQERRIVTIDDADFFGSDYQTVKDVDIEGCKAACLSDVQCKAFTFNTSAGWCFLKSEFGQLQSFTGAIAGRVVMVQQKRVDASTDRKAELRFLSTTTLESAETYSRSIKNSVRRSELTVDQIRRNGMEALTQRNGALAEADFLQLVGLDASSFQAWTHLTSALLLQNPKDWQEQQLKRKNAVSAAVNSYLRANSKPERAFALQLLGRTLERQSEFKIAIKALRASLVLEKNPDLQQRYDRLVANYGFRIVEHQIDSDSASPRVCLVFSQKLPNGADLGAYVSVRGEGKVSIESEGMQVCADGVRHGTRYEVTARSGLPAADGEVLEKSSTLSVYVRDRAPSVHFIGRSYVLPSGGDPTIPIVSVNTREVEATVYRVGDRSLSDVLRDNRFLRQLGNYQAEKIEHDLGEKVWSGIVETENPLNSDVTTAIPLKQIGIEFEPGVYAMTARSKLDVQNRWGPMATQWFIVSDLGLSTMTGDAGIWANVRSLSTAGPKEKVKVRLVAINNEILGEATTDAQGVAEFPAGLVRGRGGNAPSILVAETADGDYSFLDLRKPAFDLSDRGVEGRPAPGPLDVFVWTDRGVYKAGETVHVQSLLRTAKAVAQQGLPLTYVFRRPDGVEHQRVTVSDAGLGGYLHDLRLSGNAQQGIWSWEVYIDPKGSPLASKTFLVEDYQPERVDFELITEAAFFSQQAATDISLSAKYLYGSPASGQTLEGDLIVRPVRSHAAYPGFQFGLDDSETISIRGNLPSGLKTDDEGALTFKTSVPELPETTALYQAEVVARLVEAGGRFVERTLEMPVSTDSPRIGIRPAFEGGLDEGASAEFSVIVVDPGGKSIAANDLEWTLSRIDRRYQWYRLDGRWSYEAVTTASRVASGSMDVVAAKPISLSVPVEWGEYKLEVQGTGALQTATSVTFQSGWYTANASSETPDYLDVGLDKKLYRPGDVAKLRLKPQMAGTAVINVVSPTKVQTRSVEVSARDVEIELPVEGDWGAGAYVTASLYRSMDLAEKRMPSRAIGLSWLQLDPGDRKLAVVLDAPEQIRPETDLDVTVRLSNLKAGEEAYLTLAAVDVGILNLTSYETPDPAEWYFGQRSLGADVRDLYGQLIDRTAGTRGRVRSGGDAMGMRIDAPPPDEEPVALFSGLVKVGENGEATVSFEVPSFNGALRLMAVAWTKDGTGHGEREVEVRSPVVLTASAPAFLAPGDASRILLEIDNVDGVDGAYELEVSASGFDVGVDGQGYSQTLDLVSKEKHQVILPFVAGQETGRGELIASLLAPNGDATTKRLGLDIRNTQPLVVRNSSLELAAGGRLSLSAATFDELQEDTVKVTLAAGGAANIDIAGLLAALDRYPYGCTEQTTSRALPLLYLSEVAEAAGLGSDDMIRKRVVKAISDVLANQSSSGAFGLWNSYASGDSWLDAYVTDFLTRAREKGYQIPDLALTTALDNLENRLSYAADFQNGGEDIAYALYVLARNGRASMGDLRYYLDAKLGNFATPLAKAQVSAGLALYGDSERAASGFQAAVEALSNGRGDGYRSDFGSRLRDSAGVADYVVSASLSSQLDLRAKDALKTALELSGGRSTQEMSWLLMAADALNKSAEEAKISINGEETAGRLAWSFTADDLSRPASVQNNGLSATSLLVSVTGQPTVPEPAGGRDYSVEREMYDLDGNHVDPTAVPVNTRLAVVVKVRALTDQPGRLMVVDRLPAGLTIDNPRLVRSGDLGGLPFLSTIDQPEHTAFHADRFEVAVDQTRQEGKELTFAYLARAATPGRYVHPPASVEDMYQPDRRAVTETGTFVVLGPTR